MARNKGAAAAEAAGGEEEATEATAVEAPAKNKKDPKPEGYVSPVLFAKLWSCVKAGVEPNLENYGELEDAKQVRPQIIYGYLRNNSAFAEAAVETNTDGHLMVNTQAGLKFLTDWTVSREAKKAAKAEADVAKAAEAAEEAATEA